MDTELANTEYTNLINEYITGSSSNKLTELDELRIFRRLEELKWFISKETETAMDKKLDTWLRAQ